MVRPNPKSSQFREAAEPTLKRIRRDRRRVSARAAPLVAFIEERLFDADLELRLRKRLENLPDDVVRDFCEALGATPLGYVRERRLDVADRLLRSTRWRVWLVAEELGFRNAKVLSSAFKARTGTLPSKVRPKVQPRPAGASRKPARKQPQRPEVQALIGALEPQGMVALVQRVRSLFPAPPRREPSRPPVELSMPGYRHERELAETVWQTTRDLPAELLRSVMCRRLRFQSPALFRLLGEKGREIGRQDRKRGVAVVELGVEVLEASADAFGEELHDHLTVGWSWTANQRRLLWDWPGTEEAFGFARAEWEMPRTSRDPLAEAEFRFWEGTFRLYQRRFDEAFESLSRSIELSRRYDNSELLVKALLQRVELARHVDNPQMASDDLHEAMERITDRDDPYLMVTVKMSLIALYMRLDRLEEIPGLFDAVEPLARSVASPLVDAQLLWLKGLVCMRRSELDSAESLLWEAHGRLISQGETGHAAILALDLMELFVERGQVAKVRGLIIETLSILETFKLHREVLAAMRLLRSALETRELDLEVLNKVRRNLRSLKRFSIA